MRHSTMPVWLLLLPLLISGCGGGGGGGQSPGSALSPNTISGKITLNGAGLGQVTLQVTGVPAGTSDGSGNYSFTQLVNGQYTVTPSRAGYSFTPASRTVTIGSVGGTADFTALPIPTYRISGTVTSGNGGGVAGVTVTVKRAATGASVASQLTDGSGRYAVTGLLDGAYLVAVSYGTGFSFTPGTELGATLQGADGSVDFAIPGIATYAVSGRVTGPGGAGFASVTVSLSDGFYSGVTVSTVTDSQGNYTLSGVPEGYYTLAPAITGYVVAPQPQLSIHLSGGNQSGKDFSATPEGSGTGDVVITL